jgi:hypothetical protein
LSMGQWSSGNQVCHSAVLGSANQIRTSILLHCNKLANKNNWGQIPIIGRQFYLVFNWGQIKRNFLHSKITINLIAIQAINTPSRGIKHRLF